MSLKPLLLSLCLSLLCLSVAVLSGAGCLPSMTLSPQSSTASASTAPERSVTLAALPVDFLLAPPGDRSAEGAVTLRASHPQWDLWSQALQRTRQLLWMLTRHQTLRQGTQLA